MEFQDGSKTYYVTAIFKSTNFSGELQGSDEGREVDFFGFDSLPSPLFVSARGAVNSLKKIVG
jgi:hypothetical protein